MSGNLDGLGYRGKTIVVTGGSSGMGEQVVRILADHFVAAQAEHGQRRRIDEGATSIEVEAKDPFARRVEQGIGALLSSLGDETTAAAATASTTES